MITVITDLFNSVLIAGGLSAEAAAAAAVAEATEDIFPELDPTRVSSPIFLRLRSR